MGHLTIAIDFDDTFTADTQAWSDVIRLLQAFGYTVLCVTGRSDFEVNRTEIENALPNGVSVFLTSGMQKDTFMRSRGFNVDIWIDDCPAVIPSIKDLSLSLEWSMGTENGVCDD